MVVLFKPYHISMIRSGSKNVTRREWDTPQVKPGNTYIASTELFTSHEDADCYITVTDVYEQRLGEMTHEDATREGDYTDMYDFKDGYERVYGDGSFDPWKTVWVVEFEYAGRFPPCSSGDGHAWVAGEAELDDESGLVEVVSRQCRRCGYVDSLNGGKNDGD